MPSLPYRQLNFIQFKSPVYFTEGSFYLFFFFLNSSNCWVRICAFILKFGSWAVKPIQSTWSRTTGLHRVCVLCLVTSCHLFFHFLSFLSEQEPVFLLLYDRKWRQHFLFLSSLSQQEQRRKTLTCRFGSLLFSRNYGWKFLNQNF